jgi:hypothetical protein
MTSERIQTLAGSDGHTATLKYALAEGGGWDVLAQLDDRTVAVRHCSQWHGVERLYEWLRLQLPQEAP